ncbi:type II secretion system protein [Deinococcus ruber]|uniref:Prepilin-type N-terminal cleavage/methylation domain-containing protein n=1 Tax=Deinococcus ruber TaxID=1848197 RepID=A0A918C7U7_9DEIO|nr:type II secretion system protein [Deinococcus ruber]GGR10031.1 hypothetical protein GCM10008957_23520 [Deinococcus ruber]
MSEFRPAPHVRLSSTRTQGFTLIELLVVIAIIGILAAILIPSFSASRKKPYDVAALQCGKAIISAQITYMSEHNDTPANGLAQLNNADVTEQCAQAPGNIQVGKDAENPTNTVTTGGTGLISTGGSNYAFKVWSPLGVSVYGYNKDAGTHLLKQN